MTRSDADRPVQHLPLHKTVSWKQLFQKVRGSDCFRVSRLLSTNCFTGALRFLRKNPLMRLALKTVLVFVAAAGFFTVREARTNAAVALRSLNHTKHGWLVQCAAHSVSVKLNVGRTRASTPGEEPAGLVLYYQVPRKNMEI